jgi:hypothetical protein
MKNENTNNTKIPLSYQAEAYRRLKAMPGLEEKVLNVLPNPPCNQKKGAKEASDLLKRCVAAAVAASVEVAEERVLFEWRGIYYEKWVAAFDNDGRPVRTDGTAPLDEPRIVIHVVAPDAWNAINDRLYDILGLHKWNDLYDHYNQFGIILPYYIDPSELRPRITGPEWFFPDNTGCHDHNPGGVFFCSIDKLLHEKRKTGK